MLEAQDSFIGGHPILDFINTVEDQDKSRLVSHIHDWQRFLNWIEHSTLFNAHHKAALIQYDEAESNRVLTELHTTRDALYAMFNHLLSTSDSSAITSQEIHQQKIPQKIEASIQTAISHASLIRQGDQYQWQSDTSASNWFIDVLYLSLDDLLRTQEINKLRECGRCTWLFLNSGRGRGRRWCRMSTCGNREKSEYFRKRQSKVT
jgi:predicted RNA-binding Zn ribbon-like protein